jgi:hypothetical protein
LMVRSPGNKKGVANPCNPLILFGQTECSVYRFENNNLTKLLILKN